MRSILLHIGDDDGLADRVQVAVDLANARDGHLTCLQPIPLALEIPGDLYGAMIADVVPAIRDAADKLRGRIEDDLRDADVSWTWMQSDGAALDRLLHFASLNDVAIVGTNDGSAKGVSSLPGDLVIRARTPVLLVPPKTHGFDCRGSALVAWNGSPEACHALRAAVPLLAQSRSVTLAIVEESQKRPADLPPTAGAEYLSRHGISCKIVEIPASYVSIAYELGECALNREVSYLVMGAYGHSRAYETVFGGVTRELFAHAPVPLPILAFH